MPQYINKSDLLEEIKKKIKQYEKAFDNPSFASYEASLIAKGKYRKLLDILQFIKTFEVKEVDLEKEYEEFVVDDPIFGKFIINDTMGMELAKHFFELGLKTQHSNISIPDIDDLLEEDGIDPTSKDAKIFKESYYMALEKLKEKKEE